MILLIGATGFLGPVVLEKLLEKDYKVKCLVRSDSNRNKLEEVSKRLKKEKDVTFNIGTLQSEDSIFTNLKEIDSAIYLVDLENTYLVRNFLRASKRANLKRAIFISSTTVLLPMESKIKEKKLNSENLIKDSELNWTILRPTMIYGTSDDENFSKMINFIKKRGFFVVFGNGQNLIQPIYVEDVADAILSVLENSKTYKKTYEICGKEPIKYIDMLKVVKTRMGRPFRIIHFPITFSKFLISIYNKFTRTPVLTPDQIERMKVDKVYSYDKAFRDFAFLPKSFEYGIEKLIQKIDP